MEMTVAVAALSALAQESRLAMFRLLVQAGPDGMAAGEVAEALDLAPNTLTFHFDVMNQLLGYLTENCCQGRECAPTRRRIPAPALSRRREKAT